MPSHATLSTKMKPLLLGGPSGSGKTHLCQALEERGWLHLNADQFPENKFHELGLENELDCFWIQKNPIFLMETLKKQMKGESRLVLSLPSLAITEPDLLERSLPHLAFLFLYGHPKHCLKSFLERERSNGRGLDPAFWWYNNESVFRKLAKPVYRTYLAYTFDSEGNRLEVNKLIERAEQSVKA